MFFFHISTFFLILSRYETLINKRNFSSRKKENLIVSSSLIRSRNFLERKEKIYKHINTKTAISFDSSNFLLCLLFFIFFFFCERLSYDYSIYFSSKFSLDSFPNICSTLLPLFIQTQFIILTSHQKHKHLHRKINSEKKKSSSFIYKDNTQAIYVLRGTSNWKLINIYIFDYKSTQILLCRFNWNPWIKYSVRKTEYDRKWIELKSQITFESKYCVRIGVLCLCSDNALI